MKEKKVRVFTSGSFDLFHIGHLNILEKSALLGDELIVGVSTDELIQHYKGMPPIIPFEQRMRIVSSIKCVTKVVKQVKLTEIAQLERENIDIVPLYYAAKRPVVERDGMLIMVDDDRFKLKEGEKIEYRNVRFRTLGCYPLTGGIESNATTLDEIIDETLSAVSSERTTRVIDNEAAGSMERRKREGYF